MTQANRRLFLKTLGTAGALSLLPSLASARPPDKNAAKKDKAKGGPYDSRHNDVPALVTAGVSAAVARDLFRRSGGVTGAHKPLPPGIRKNLARGKPIPPGIAKTRLPDGYLGHLPSHPGYEWVGAGLDLLLVQIASGLIADVLFDVFL